MVKVSNRLIKETDNLINTYLMENRTVSNAVSNMATDCCNKILEKIPKTNAFRDENGRKSKKGSFTYREDGGISFIINWTVTYYKTDKVSKFESQSSGSCSIYDHTITVNIIVVNGRINKDSLIETLQYEIFHLFEYYKKKKEYLGMREYIMAYNALKNDNGVINSKTNASYMVNALIYIFFEFENRVVANEAYRILMNSNDYLNKFGNAIKKTKIYNWLVTCRQFRYKIEHTSEDSPGLKVILSRYGINKAEILQLADETIEGLLRIIGRIIAKAMDDYRGQHNIIEYPDATPLTLEELERFIPKNRNKREAILKKYFN